MRYGMTIDLKRCIGCFSCVMACKVEHFTPPGVFWGRLLETEEGQYPSVRRTFLPMVCYHCLEPPCREVCPTGATVRREEDGIVWIDQNKCVGCRYCVIACPYQNRTFLPKAKDRGYFPAYGLTDFEKMGKKLYPHTIGTTVKCNFCMERIDSGLEKGLKPGIDPEATPVCVQTCPTTARVFGDLDDPLSEVSKLIRERGGYQHHAEMGTDPSVYYLR